MALPPSLWLSNTPHHDARAAARASAEAAAQDAPSMVLGVVQATPAEEPDLPAGWVRVGIPHPSPTSSVTGRTDGGLTAVGAVVAVLLDQHGKPLQITSPISLPEGATPVPMGALGARVEEAMVSGGTTVLRLAHEPRTEDAAGRPAGTHAWVYSSPSLTGRVLSWWVWDGSAWVRQEIAPELIVPYVTTDMLTAGGATVAGRAVVGDLVGNTLVGGRIVGGEFELADASRLITVAADPQRWLSTEGSPMVSGSTVSVNFSQVSPQKVSILEYVSSPTGARSIADLSAHLRLRSSVTQDVLVMIDNGGGHAKQFVHLEAGADTPVTVKVGDCTRKLVNFSAYVRVFKPCRLEVLEYVETWREPDSGGAGLHIGRDSAGNARIEIRERTGGGRAVLDSSGVTYQVGDTLVGREDWRNLIAPPRAVVQWPANAGLNAASGKDGILTLNDASLIQESGGFTHAGGWLVVPVTGWYWIVASAGFKWPTTQSGWAAAVGLYRRSIGRVDWDRDPADTRALIPSVTTRPTAVGMAHLAAGEGLCLGHWQNTGSWRPNIGLSTLSAMLVDAD